MTESHHSEPRYLHCHPVGFIVFVLSLFNYSAVQVFTDIFFGKLIAVSLVSTMLWETIYTTTARGGRLRWLPLGLLTIGLLSLASCLGNAASVFGGSPVGPFRRLSAGGAIRRPSPGWPRAKASRPSRPASRS
jgi:hypothetical protein